jgi:hypothetical protein
VGDAVCALTPGGGYAEYAVTPAAHALPVPHGMGLREAACLPETFFTVWSNVFQRGGLKAGEVFLVHGGSSGIGTTAIQLAHGLRRAGLRHGRIGGQMRGLREARRRTRDQLPRRGFRRGAEGRGRGGPDPRHGGRQLPAAQRPRAEDDGRLVQIAFLEGPKVELNFAEVMMRRLTITGSTLRPQSDLAKARIAAALREHVWPLLEAGRIAPVMDSDLPARGGGGRACPDGRLGPYREDRAASLTGNNRPHRGFPVRHQPEDSHDPALPSVLASLPRSAAAAQEAVTVEVSESDEYGEFLTVGGYPVYLFSDRRARRRATPPVISCVGECLAAWPPVAGEAVEVGPGADAILGEIDPAVASARSRVGRPRGESFGGWRPTAAGRLAALRWVRSATPP